MGRPTAEPALVARLIHDFCWDWAPNHLTTSAHTLRNYRTAPALFLTWLEDEGGVTPSTLRAPCFSAANVESWLEWLSRERGNTPQTCNVRLSSLRAFCRYASRHEASLATLEAEVSAVPKRKAPKARVRGLTRDAVRALSHAPGTSTRQGVRDTTLIVTLYATACRVGELLSMRISQLHLDDASPYALVAGKGGKSRVVYLPDKAVAHLRAYLSEFHGPEPAPDSYVFWSRNHEPGTRPLTSDAVGKMLKRRAAEARASCKDVPEGLHAHQLRHARSSHWLEDGMSLAQVSLLLGHESVETTMSYLDVTIDAKSDAMSKVTGAPDAPRRWKSDSARGLLVACGLARG